MKIMKKAIPKAENSAGAMCATAEFLLIGWENAYFVLGLIFSTTPLEVRYFPPRYAQNR